MKYLNLVAVFSFAIVFGALKAFGQEVTPPSSNELMAFLGLLGGLGSLKGAALAMLIIQGLMLLFRSPLANFAGKWKLSIILGLSFFMAFVGVLASGKHWTQAIFDGAVISAFQVFANQMWKQFATDKGNESNLLK